MLDLGRTVINYKNAYYKIYFLHLFKEIIYYCMCIRWHPCF